MKQEISFTSERLFREFIVKSAKKLGWFYYHAPSSPSSFHSVKGFPDLVLVKAPRVIFAELKLNNGHTFPDQDKWIDTLSRCDGIIVGVWRPRDWDKIADLLARS